MSMKTLGYYFEKKSNDPVDAGCAGPSPKSPHHQPTINMVIGKRKRLVGRPQKAPPPN